MAQFSTIILLSSKKNGACRTCPYRIITNKENNNKAPKFLNKKGLPLLRKGGFTFLSFFPNKNFFIRFDRERDLNADPLPLKRLIHKLMIILNFIHPCLTHRKTLANE